MAQEEGLVIAASSGALTNGATRDPMVPLGTSVDPWTPGQVDIKATSPIDSGDVEVHFIDAGTKISKVETVTVVGAGAAVPINGGLDVARLNRMMFSAFNLTGNVSQISAQFPLQATPRLTIAPGQGASEWGAWAAARDRELILHSLFVTNFGSVNYAAAGVRCRVTLYGREWGSNNTKVWQVIATAAVTAGGGDGVTMPLGDIVVRPGHEIKLVSESAGGTSLAHASIAATERRLPTW